MGLTLVFGGFYKFKIVVSLVEDVEISGCLPTEKQIKLWVE